MINMKMDTMHRVLLDDAGEIEMYQMADRRVRLTLKALGFDQTHINIHKSQLNKLARFMDDAINFFQENDRC